MAISQEFMETVDMGKTLRTKIMLKDSMLVDPTLITFEEMISYAEDKMPDLYDEHDEEVLKYSVGDWTESYLNAQMVAVVGNFSRERIELLKNVVRYLYKDKANIIKEERVKENFVHISRKQIGAGIAVAGAAVTVAGICASEGLIIAGGVVLAAAGVALIISDKEN